MMDFWISMGINLVLTALQVAIKNPDSREAMKRACYKLYTNLLLVYPEFAETSTKEP